MASVRQLTTAAHGHTIANRGCWSADGASVLYDLRDEETRFDGPAIERVLVDSGRVERLYQAPAEATCGVPTCSGNDDRYVFIHSDAPLTPDWNYCAWHRHGAVGRISAPGEVQTLDARDIVAPYTAGALRGGTHLHLFDADGGMILSTYEDHVLATSDDPRAEANRRGLAVTLLDHPVVVPKVNVRNHDGCGFTVALTRLSDSPRWGSDELFSASGEAWVGQRRQIAFQGTVIDGRGNPCVELFLLDLPSDPAELCRPADHPLAGTPETRPGVPRSVVQRRLTDTTDWRFPGLQGPRHWAVSSPDGQWIGGYWRDSQGRVQFWVVATAGGPPRQVTVDCPEPTSAFTWHPDGTQVCYAAAGSVMSVDVASGRMHRLTPPLPPQDGPTHHGCVFSPDGSQIVFMQPVTTAAGRFNQLHVVSP